MRTRSAPLARLLFWLLAVPGVALRASPAAVTDDPLRQAGERIYLEGSLPSGAPLRATRNAGGQVQGTAAACVNCHKRSGLGSAEGAYAVPPITARFLYARAGQPPGRPTLSRQAASDASREPYTDATLATAIRDGKGRAGRALDELMPRYALAGDDMAALLAYLRSLPTTPSPGVGDTALEFATVVTPDADPVARDAMLAVLDAFIADKNAFLRGGARALHSDEQIRYRVTRGWHLHVWTLSGPPSGWEQQLQEHLAAEPVFAVLSGIGGAQWAPVHHFCEVAKLPCLFPNVAVPVDAEQDYYNVYLSRGLLLDAQLLAHAIDSHAAALPGHGRLVQLHGTGDGSGAAAERLAALVADHFESRSLEIAAGDPQALANALASVRPGDVLALWLGPGALAQLGAPPAGVAGIYVAGGLAGLEDAPLPPAWRTLATMSYPVDLPAARAIRMTYPLRWMQIRGVPITAPKVQADTYLACGIVSEVTGMMLDSFMRDFLVERLESMVSKRQLTAYYPRLGLAPGQRFASKGGYLVRFSAPEGSAIAPLGDWLVP